MIWPLLFSLLSVCTLSYAKSNIITLAGPGTVDWGYLKKTLPTDWGKIDSRCNGVRQSPINILTARTVYDRSLKDIIIRRQDVTSAAENWQLERTSYGANFVPDDSIKKFSFFMSPENERYELLQMHFHWRGSEHEIDGKKYAAELHLVHVNENDPNKLAVLGFIFALSDKNNTRLENIIESLENVRNIGDPIYETTSIKLNEIVPTRFKKYYRYPGSLTVPKCGENVEWFVIQDPILTISEKQLIDLQRYEDNDGFLVLTNSRPVQPLNGRTVRRSFHISQTNYPSTSYRSSSYPTNSYPQLYYQQPNSYSQRFYPEPSYSSYTNPRSSYSQPSYRQSNALPRKSSSDYWSGSLSYDNSDSYMRNSNYDSYEEGRYLRNPFSYDRSSSYDGSRSSDMRYTPSQPLYPEPSYSSYTNPRSSYSQPSYRQSNALPRKSSSDYWSDSLRYDNSDSYLRNSNYDSFEEDRYLVTSPSYHRLFSNGNSRYAPSERAYERIYY